MKVTKAQEKWAQARLEKEKGKTKELVQFALTVVNGGEPAEMPSMD